MRMGCEWGGRTVSCGRGRMRGGGQGQSVGSRDTSGFRDVVLRRVGGQRAVGAGRGAQREAAGLAYGEREA